MNKRRAPRRRSSAPAADDVMWSLMHAAHAVESQIEEALAQVELSGAKLAALTQLVEADEPVTLGELAAKCACVRSNITQLVDRLEADKLVRRVDDAADRRSLRAAITPLGRERQAAGAKKVDEVRRKLGKALSAIDHAALKRALSDLD
ncbi:MAG TPA: MarR family transcriptional regulator [Burkholderiales bacterium]|nr:MarR family transcriptional regulator [Burkholderiales bacterium]